MTTMISDEVLNTLLSEYKECDKKAGLVLYDSPITAALKELKLRRQVMRGKKK